MFNSLFKTFGGNNKEPVPVPAAPVSTVSTARPAPPVAPAAPVATFTAPASNLPPVAISLRAVLAKVSPEIQKILKEEPAETALLKVPGDLVQRQLATGAVKMSYGEIRQAAPSETFGDGGPGDATLVNLPLAEIIARLPEGTLHLRADQRRVEAGVDCRAVFACRNTITPTPPVAMRATKSAVPETIAPLPPATPPPPTPRPSQPASTAPVSSPLPLPAPSFPVPLTSELMAATAPVSAPAAVAPSSVPVVAPATAITLPPLTPAVSAAPVAPMPAVSSAAPSGNLTVALASVIESWPDALRKEAAQFGGAMLSIPSEPIGVGLKTGKVVFTWKQVKTWLRPSPVTTASPHDETNVVLPLKVLAPLYMAQTRQVTPAAPSVTHAPVSAPPLVTPPAPVPLPPPSVPKPIIEAIMKTPQDCVQRTMALAGVQGALIASEQGALIAGQLPTGMQAEALARLLPELFVQMSGYAEKMNFGFLATVTIVAGGAPWQLVRAGSGYLGVMGRVGEVLPATQINALAVELAKL